MGLIIKEVGILGSKNKYKKLKALFDTGATRNYISEEFIDENTNDKYTIDDIGIVKYYGSDFVTFPNGVEKDGLIIGLKLLKINGIEPLKQPKFFLFDMKMYDIIIGAKLMQQLRMVLKPSIHEIAFS